MNILSMPFAPDGMPDECPKNSRNCDHRQIMIDVSDDELHQAMEEWVDTRGFTLLFQKVTLLTGHFSCSSLMM